MIRHHGHPDVCVQVACVRACMHDFGFALTGDTKAFKDVIYTALMSLHSSHEVYIFRFILLKLLLSFNTYDFKLVLQILLNVFFLNICYLSLLIPLTKSMTLIWPTFS